MWLVNWKAYTKKSVSITESKPTFSPFSLPHIDAIGVLEDIVVADPYNKDCFVTMSFIRMQASEIQYLITKQHKILTSPFPE